VTLTGTPGTGESLLFYWLLYKRGKQGKKTVIDNGAIFYYFDGEGNWFQTKSKSNLADIPNFLRESPGQFLVFDRP
jgi:hypothetical protein